MTTAPGEAQSKPNSGVLWSFAVIAGFGLILEPILGWFDDTTELAPRHPTADNVCFVIAGLIALICIGLGVWQTRGMNALRRILLSLLLGFMGFLVTAAATTTTADMIEGAIDFPRARTIAYPALLVISRAYQTHGKGHSSNIQTAPLWSNLEITDDDYDFMRSHRRPGDPGKNPDEISSRGYFCARVTMQRSGGALRVMHAGSHKLPTGTVMLCPPSEATIALAR